LLNAWTTAYKFHQKGFHEEQLTVEEIAEEACKIEDLLKTIEKRLGDLHIIDISPLSKVTNSYSRVDIVNKDQYRRRSLKYY